MTKLLTHWCYLHYLWKAEIWSWLYQQSTFWQAERYQPKDMTHCFIFCFCSYKDRTNWSTSNLLTSRENDSLYQNVSDCIYNVLWYFKTPRFLISTWIFLSKSLWEVFVDDCHHHQQHSVESLYVCGQTLKVHNFGGEETWYRLYHAHL